MKNKNLQLISIVCFLMTLFFNSCSKSGGSGGTAGNGGNSGGGGGTQVTVDMNGMSFSPSTTTVKVGTPVKWTNSDYYSAHTVTSNDGTTFNSGTIGIGGTYTYTPNVAGTYPYHCTIHGTAMSGTLVVTP